MRDGKMESDVVPDWFREATFERLFIDGDASAMLRQNHAEVALAAIINANEVETSLRVLAHELLIEAGHESKPQMADVYCRALPDAFAHNWWGMPGQYLERLGRSLISFGDTALSCLLALLDDKKLLGYFGSEEVTLSKKMRYRVCDLAAYFIAEILNAPYPDLTDPGAREKYISELQAMAREVNKQLQ